MSQGKQTVTDEEIIKAIKSVEGPFVTAAEIAEEFDHTRQWGHKRLQDLAEAGQISKKKSGDQAVIWWIPEN